MRLLLLTWLVGVGVACSPAPSRFDAGGPDAGTHDGGSDAGTSDAGFDAGSPPHTIESRFNCQLGAWTVHAGLRTGFDAGGFNPCLPLPLLQAQVSIGQELGVFFAPVELNWATDAGCTLALDYSFVTSNASETYTHTVHLTLEPTDAGLLFGTGTYSLTGGSNCVVPLEADGVP